MGYWRAAAKFARRDFERSRARTAFLLTAMTLSVASVGGVRSAANVARSALHRESRSWLGGDLAVTTGESLDEQQLDALNRLRSRGIAWTVVTTALTMGASDESPDPSLMAVKAVAPTEYPLYGTLTLEPPQALSAALGPHTTVVSRDALARFHLRLGDEILIGGSSFRVSAAIATEPDRFSGVTALAVRCLLSQQGFERSGLARSGDSVRLRILFRLPAGAGQAATRDRLRDLFPEASLTDFRAANRDGVSTLETTTNFLCLIALVAVALGAIGMAMTVRQHIVDRAETLAVVKTLGGRNRQVTGMFFLQIAWLAAVAFALGLPLAWGIRASMLGVAGRYIALPPAPLIDYPAILDSAAVGIAALMPTLVGTVLAIRRLKPAVLLRRDFEENPLAGTGAASGLAWAVPGLAMGAVTARLLGSWNLAAILMASLFASVGVAFLLVRALVAGARRWIRAPGLRRAPLVRHGIANLCRPGNRGQALMVALAIGLMMMIATFQINRAVTQSIVETLPFDHPDLVIPAVEAGPGGPVPTFLEHQPGVEKVVVGAQARGRLTLPDGARIANLVGCAPEGKESLEGLVKLEIADNIARPHGLRVGSRLQFEAGGRIVHPTVTAVRRITPVEELWYGVRMDCSGIDPANIFYQVAARIRPERVAAVRRAFIDEYPAIPVFTKDDLSEMIGQASHDALLLVRLVAWYALGSSLAVLIAVVAASRGFRLREMAIVSALGGRRRALVKLYTIEFAAMGVLACLAGSVLACGFTAVVVSAVLHGVHVTVEWKAPAVATVASGVLCAAAAWMPAYGLLRRKPLEILRGE